MMTDSMWDAITPKSRGNAFDILDKYAVRIDVAGEQMHADRRKRTSAAVERMRASGIEPAKLTISRKQADRDRETAFKRVRK